VRFLTQPRVNPKLRSENQPVLGFHLPVIQPLTMS
jgi:hypothetical protein